MVTVNELTKFQDQSQKESWFLIKFLQQFWQWLCESQTVYGQESLYIQSNLQHLFNVCLTELLSEKEFYSKVLNQTHLQQFSFFIFCLPFSCLFPRIQFGGGGGGGGDLGEELGNEWGDGETDNRDAVIFIILIKQMLYYNRRI